MPESTFDKFGLGLLCVFFGLCYYLISRICIGCFLASIRITYAVVKHIILILPAFVKVVKDVCRISFATPPPWLYWLVVVLSSMTAIVQVSLLADQQRRATQAWW
ncbi:hypothetical protein F5144DRAFT_643661 [Chaetomium tenue]|uniref:Uncharacterized protein n=1 Tax=Chaetomium tenue TaxID=1854479 RepID=A0ACB7PIW7_9PEZI|nr:hypothetical protein F5144DRAFT_643661 [Chaetomium globosum]